LVDLANFTPPLAVIGRKAEKGKQLINSEF